MRTMSLGRTPSMRCAGDGVISTGDRGGHGMLMTPP
jgi:hypothetical protein